MWARIRRAGAHGLRRGAWYPVLDDADAQSVLLDVNQQQVSVDRSVLELTDAKPRKWTVVRLVPGRDDAELASQAGLGPVYGVCPSCAARANLRPEDTQLTCRVCHRLFEIDWASSS